MSGNTGTWVGVGVATVGVGVSVAMYRQNSRNAARNDNSTSTLSLPTMSSMPPQQRTDFERGHHAATQEQRNAAQQDLGMRSNYESKRHKSTRKTPEKAPAASTSSSSSSVPPPALPDMPPAAVRRAEILKTTFRSPDRIARPTQESIPSRPVPSVAASGSDARTGADRRPKNATSSSDNSGKSTRRRAKPGPN